MQINSNDRTTLQYNTDHWDASVNATVQSKSSTITIYAENKNGAYLTSMTIPVSSSGDKGDPGDGSIGQTLKGSPLRIVGAWASGKSTMMEREMLKTVYSIKMSYFMKTCIMFA